MPNSSVWPIDRTLSAAAIPGQIGPGIDGNGGVLHIPQSPSITGASASDCLVPYPEQSLVRGSYLFIEMQSVSSTSPFPNSPLSANEGRDNGFKGTRTKLKAIKLMSAFFRCKVVTFLCEHVHELVLYTVNILGFKT